MAIVFNKNTDLFDYIDCNIHNSCPICNHIMQPEILVLDKKDVYGKVERVFPGMQGEKKILVNEVVEVLSNIVLKCTAYDCGNVFIAHYKSKAYTADSVKDSELVSLSPYKKPIFDINTSLEEISQEFYSIYEEALVAESKGLSQICGMGYRKALEFLVKDYVIYIKGEDLKDKEAFLIKDLGKILANDIENTKIVSMARRAAWLGNDEAHYKRKWVEKDTQDLKAIIKVVVNEMENEMIFRKTLEDMPSGR